ncbi:MAG: cupin domain-containing protein [Myxococcales bacterium]|nr:cupin domain-containing protein [Myxococcales bacterium]
MNTQRPLALIAAFLLGACTGTAAYTMATPAPTSGKSGDKTVKSGSKSASGQQLAARPTIPPAAASAGPTVTALADAEKRQVGGGKAVVQFLAHGSNAWLGKLTMAANGKVPLHRDKTEEYIHVLSGGGVIAIDGKKSRLQAGSTVFMPANAEVTYQNGPAPMVAIQVFAGPAPAATYNRWKKP